MKVTHLLLGVALITLAACSTPQGTADEAGSAMRNAQGEGPSPAVKVPAAGAEEAPVRKRGTSNEPMHDANGNGIEDAIDITDGTSDDLEGNGIPDDGESDS